jgi:1,4-dihydroxy-2-naphthoyl-CoA hydrolase
VTAPTPSPEAYAERLAREIPADCAIAAMGITPVAAENGVASARMVVGAHHLNQVGAVQGGVYALFADATAGFAAMSALPDGKTFATLEMRVNLLRGVRPGTALIAEATPVHRGGTTMVFEVRVWDQAGTRDRPAAFFVCTQLVMDKAPA